MRSPRRRQTASYQLRARTQQVCASAYRVQPCSSVRRPTAGQRTFFMGPAQRVVGGQLRWVYPEHVPSEYDTCPLLRAGTRPLLVAATSPRSPH